MLERAIEFAVKCHAGQYRKHAIDGQRLPYIVHAIEVMRTIWGWGVTDPTIMTAAVLHDVLEESEITARQLEKEFGGEVAQLVTDLTHDPQDGDKHEYLKRFATASVPALVVKLADRYCNIQHRLVGISGGSQGLFREVCRSSGDHAIETCRDCRPLQRESVRGHRLCLSGFGEGRQTDCRRSSARSVI